MKSVKNYVYTERAHFMCPNMHFGLWQIVMKIFVCLKYLLMMVERIIVCSTEEKNWKVSKKKCYSFHNCHMLELAIASRGRSAPSRGN